MAEAPGSDEGTPPPRESAFERVDCVSCGLPPLLPLGGMDMGAVLADGAVDFAKLVFELFLRSINGIDGLLPPLALGPFLGDRLSKRFLISGGMGTE